MNKRNTIGKIIYILGWFVIATGVIGSIILGSKIPYYHYSYDMSYGGGIVTGFNFPLTIVGIVSSVFLGVLFFAAGEIICILDENREMMRMLLQSKGIKFHRPDHREFYQGDHFGYYDMRNQDYKERTQWADNPERRGGRHAEGFRTFTGQNERMQPNWQQDNEAAKMQNTAFEREEKDENTSSVDMTGADRVENNNDSKI